MKRPVCIITLVLLFVIFIYYRCNLGFLWEAIPKENNCTCLGTVYSKEYQNDKLVVYLKNISVKNNSKKYEGVICYISSSKEPKMGSIIEVNGKPVDFTSPANPGEFNAKKYYKILKQDFMLKDAVIIRESVSYSAYKENLYTIKKKLFEIYDSYLDKNDSALLKAVILGNKKELTKEQKSLYQLNGISHIMAISGVVISILGK